jgi:hypothetical protein
MRVLRKRVAANFWPKLIYAFEKEGRRYSQKCYGLESRQDINKRTNKKKMKKKERKIEAKGREKWREDKISLWSLYIS